MIIHDTAPENFCEKLHPKDNVPQGRLFDFFSKDNNVITARYKWLATLKKEYKIFWKSLLDEVRPEDTDKTILVVINDLVPVVEFINPRAMHMIYNHVNYPARLNELLSSAAQHKHFVSTRHRFYYKWMYFGWRILPSNYPLYKHWKDDLSQVTNWIHKRVLHDEFINLNLYTTSQINNYITKMNSMCYDREGIKCCTVYIQTMAEGNTTPGETTPVPMARVEFSPTDTGFLLVIGVRKEKWAGVRAHMKVSTQRLFLMMPPLCHSWG